MVCEQNLDLDAGGLKGSWEAQGDVWDVVLPFLLKIGKLTWQFWRFWNSATNKLAILIWQNLPEEFSSLSKDTAGSLPSFALLSPGQLGGMEQPAKRRGSPLCPPLLPLPSPAARPPAVSPSQKLCCVPVRLQSPGQAVQEPSGCRVWAMRW